MPSPADAIIPANHGDGEARRRIAAAFARLASSPKPLLVFVTHARGGGVARHVHELAELIAPAAGVLVLRPHRRSYLALAGVGEHAEARLWFHHGEGWNDLCAFLRALGVARVHYHHVQGMPQRILELAREVGCPYDVTVHDYYPLCPQFQLTDASGRYCGEPDEAGCTRCITANPAQWPIGIARWRAAFGRLLGDADRVIAPSRDAARRIERYFPAVSAQHWPHSEPASAGARSRKVLVLGGLSPAKGMDLVEACARDARERRLALRFRVIGHIARPVDDEAGLPLTFTGEYPEGALATLIEQERGDAILFPAQWPETYSYTLTAAIDSGLPIVATDLGALPERLAGLPGSRVIAWNEGAPCFNDALAKASGGDPGANRPHAERGDAARYRSRYLEAVVAREASSPEPAVAPPGLASAPDEWVPEATLAELFDDGVRCGNGRSLASLRERAARADAELLQLPLLRERLRATQAQLDGALAQAAELRRESASERSAPAGSAVERVAAMEASTSWRLTAPLRAIARFFRR